jgi:long-chain acyl-CoA synthetase
VTSQSDLDPLASLPERICDVLQPSLDRQPNHPALVESNGAWSYSELGVAVGAAVTWLREAGVRPGDRVMIVCENCRAFVAILLALARLNAWPVLVNARLSPPEVDRISNHCGARRVIYTVGASAQARRHAIQQCADIYEKNEFGPIGIGPLNATTTPEPLEPDPSQNVAALIYTSGTTGHPKGVMLSHRNLLHVAEYSSKIRLVKPDDGFLGILPMSHAVGLAGVLLGGLLRGATVFLFPRFDPAITFAALKTNRVTIMMGAPAMFSLLTEYAKSKGFTSVSFPALRLISSSGAALEAHLKVEVERLLGIVLHNGYGVTECSPTISLTGLETPRKDTSVGRIFPGVEVRLVDETGSVVPEGAVGELQVRGPNVMKGYYRSQEETAAAIDANGWFNTRDLARFEGDHLFIVGRTKELIVRFGFNVHPVEVEAVLNTHPLVERSAVVGHAVAGDEEVIAFLQLFPGSAEKVNDVARYAARNLASYKQPTRIFVLEKLPVTPTGKVAKDVLAKMLAEGLPAS